MERSINSLLGFDIGATDGEIGEIDDFYFDDETWTLRYLVLKTGSWLHGRKVLISLTALINDPCVDKAFDVNMTMDQVKNSPDIDTDKPVSRQQEAMLNQHHFWGIYWGGGPSGGGMGVPASHIHINESDQTPGEDHHLRSVNEVSGYQIHALDENVGHVNDFIIDDKTWKLLYFVVDTHNWIGGKKVLIPVSEIRAVSFMNWEVFVNLTKSDIEACELFHFAEYNA